MNNNCITIRFVIICWTLTLAPYHPCKLLQRAEQHPSARHTRHCVHSPNSDSFADFGAGGGPTECQ